jgi:RNA-directed DNA polymerase
LHYLVPRVAGGKDSASNLILLHPQCHRYVHDHQLTIVKPAPARGL